jgi:hypothetical protein
VRPRDLLGLEARARRARAGPGDRLRSILGLLRIGTRRLGRTSETETVSRACVTVDRATLAGNDRWLVTITMIADKLLRGAQPTGK